MNFKMTQMTTKILTVESENDKVLAISARLSIVWINLPNVFFLSSTDKHSDFALSKQNE